MWGQLASTGWRCAWFLSVLILVGLRLPSDVAAQSAGQDENGSGATLPLVRTHIIPPASGARKMHEDAKVIMITGRAIGRDGEPSDLSVTINGVEFSMMIYPDYPSHSPEDGAGESALQTCDFFSQQIATYTLGARVVPEFDTQCLSLSGEAALLLIQAHPDNYDIPADEDSDTEKWLKNKRRFLEVTTKSTDAGQKLIVK